jgi:GNAT superfamily N-acetyltransferase
VGEGELLPVVHTYETDISREHFLSYETPGGRLAGFLRLSLPLFADQHSILSGARQHVLPCTVEGCGDGRGSASHPSTASALRAASAQDAPLIGPAEEVPAIWEIMPEIAGAAMIREVHVYGPALGIGSESAGEAQHLGLGRRLIAEAKEHARAAGFDRLAVISAIGTRRYYERLGFERGELYMIAPLNGNEN